MRNAKRTVTPWAAIGLALICGISVIYRWQLGVAGDAWLRQWGLIPARLVTGDLAELNRLVTAIFVHVDPWHLIGNLVFLALFAPRVEARLGSLRSLGLYLFCGALANGIAAFVAPESRAPIVGASGVISALLGAFLTLNPTARIGVVLPLGLYWQVLRVPALVLIGGWFTLQLMYTFWTPALAAVAWWTHIAGFVSGLILAAPARFYRTGPRPTR